MMALPLGLRRYGDFLLNGHSSSPNAYLGQVKGNPQKGYVGGARLKK